MKTIIKGIVGTAALALTASVASASTLDDVRANGAVKCGVHTGLTGFAAPGDDDARSARARPFSLAERLALHGPG
jgi:hypothetical protein